jgi:hypothetical protein
MLKNPAGMKEKLLRRNSTAISLPSFFITTVNSLILFKEVIDIYSENHTKPINTKYRFNEGGAYSYHQSLKG